MSYARRIAPGVSAPILALTLVLNVAVPAATAETIYPDNKITGTSFDAGMDGWTDVAGHCSSLLGLLSSTDADACNTHTSHAADVGTPPGSLQQSYDGTLGGLLPLLFSTTAIARSAPFTMQPNLPGASGKTSFEFDRRAEVPHSLLGLGSRASYTFTLVDDSAGGTALELFQEELGSSDDVFQGWLTGGLPHLVPGHTYHIELETDFDGGLLSLSLRRMVANFDNIRLRVADGTPDLGRPTVVTLPATDITATSATLNASSNASGLPSTSVFRYGVGIDALTMSSARQSAGSGLTSQPSSRAITGLAACTTYFFRIEATNKKGTSAGSTRSFRTDCKPTVITLPATNVGPNGATFNSSVNPEGLETTVSYRYGVGDAFNLTAGPLTIPAGRSDVEPPGIAVSGLTKQSTYRVRVVATNSRGTSVGDPATFTPGNAAPGSQGVTAAAAQADATAAGAPLASGAPARDPKPPKPPRALPRIANLPSTDKRAMIRFDAKRIVVPLHGRRSGHVRIRVLCRPVAATTCYANIKLRTASRINPAGLGQPYKKKRRVTWASDDIRLRAGTSGFVILDFNAQRRGLLQKVGATRSTVLITVVDARDRRQKIRAEVTVAAAERAVPKHATGDGGGSSR